MYTNVNLAAPIGAIALIGTVLVLAVLGVVLFYSLVTRKSALTRFAVLIAGVICGAYLLLMLGFSAGSSAQILARGQEKHFCELDCHLAYSVQDVQRVKTIGNTSAGGTFLVVTIKTRFDETTIGPARGNSPLSPNSRVLTVVEAQRHTYSPSPEGQRALMDSNGEGTPITAPLRPGESYTSVFVFDVPDGIISSVLLISEADWITHLIIGHENSLAHKKTSLQI